MADDTAAGPARPGFRLSPGMTWRRWLIDMLLIAGGIVSVIFELLSIAVHSVIGLIFAGSVGPHLWHRRAWIRGTLGRLRQRAQLAGQLRWGPSRARPV